jgi:hypothetical protein
MRRHDLFGRGDIREIASVDLTARRHPVAHYDECQADLRGFGPVIAAMAVLGLHRP